MREILLYFIIAGICLGGLITPVIGLLGYVWFALMRPDAWAWSSKPFSMIVAITTLAVSWRHIPSFPNLIKNPIARMLLLQQIPIAASVIFAVQMELSLEMYWRYVRLVVIVLLIPIMIETENWLRTLYWVMVFSMGMIALKFGVWSAVHGGVALVTGFAGMYGDTNGIALAMAILIPLAINGVRLTSNYLVKIACLGITASAVITVVMTGSRGNMLAVAATFLFMVARSKYKVVGFILVVLLALPAIYLSGERLTARLETIVDYESDLSATNRLDFWFAAIKMFQDYPVLGVGYGEKNYIALSSEYLGRPSHWVVHNSYLQMLVDTGVFGFFLYTVTWWGTIFWLGLSARRMKRLKPEWYAYPVAFQTSLFAFAIGSTFYSRSDFEFAYIVLMAAAAWYAIEKKALSELVQAPPAAVRTFAPPARAIASSRLRSAPY